MIFKSNVPMSHRAAFVLAAMYTTTPLLRLARGASLHPFDFLAAALFWILVVYQWRVRKTLKWQLRNAEGYGHHTPADFMQTRIDRLISSIKPGYWMLLILAGFVVFCVLSLRG